MGKREKKLKMNYKPLGSGHMWEDWSDLLCGRRARREISCFTPQLLIGEGFAVEAGGEEGRMKMNRQFQKRGARCPRNLLEEAGAHRDL